MATVTGLTAARMEAIEDASIVDGTVTNGELILTKYGGGTINAGSVIGPQGPAGPTFVVCTSATRPTYNSGDEGKAIFETDTNLWRMWMGTLWRTQEKIICTSATRPTALFSTDAGVKIMESDTGLEFYWTGTSWLPAGSLTARFASSAARASAWPSPPDGAMSYLDDAPGVLWIYDFGVWNSAGPPAGFCFPTILDAAPLCHVLMFGQTLANAQTSYPVLWANVPATWKSGSSLIVPDMRGRIPVGKDNMGGSAANRITSAISGLVGTTLGAVGGDQRAQLHDHDLTDPGHYHNTGESFYGTGAYEVAAGGKGIATTTSPGYTGINILNEFAGNSQNVQPSIILNWALKVI